jgi:CRP-like cAMP-binding protein
MHGLSKKGWLASQPEEFRRLIKAAGHLRWYDQREALYEVGEEPLALYGLAEGAIDLMVPTPTGEMITVHRAEPGFWIGDSALLAKAPRIVSVFAVSQSRIFCVPAEAVRDIVRRFPEYWRCFYELSHLNVARAIGEYAVLASMSPRDRLQRLLLRLSDSEGRVFVSQTELASLLFLNRSSVQRAIQELIAAGVAATEYRCIRILRPPAS